MRYGIVECVVLMVFTCVQSYADGIFPAQRFELTDEESVANMYQAVTNNNGQAAYTLYLCNAIARNDDNEAMLWLWISKAHGYEAAEKTYKTIAESSGLDKATIFSKGCLREKSRYKIDNIVNSIIRLGQMVSEGKVKQREMAYLRHCGCSESFVEKIVSGQ